MNSKVEEYIKEFYKEKENINKIINTAENMKNNSLINGSAQYNRSGKSGAVRYTDGQVDAIIYEGGSYKYSYKKNGLKYEMGPDWMILRVTIGKKGKAVEKNFEINGLTEESFDKINKNKFKDLQLLYTKTTMDGWHPYKSQLGFVFTRRLIRAVKQNHKQENINSIVKENKLTNVTKQESYEF